MTRSSTYAKTAGATAAIELGDTTGGPPTPLPQIGGFSSRGPAIANDSDVIKPDITAPGVSVLAAVAPPTNSGRDFDLYSGTSMASPHIAGLAAFMLGVHPDWSPMTVKSAMMTSAYDLKKDDGSPNQNPFDEGAGHVDPTKFFDPGLVVTSGVDDWLSFFEGQGFDFGPSVSPMAASDLNIPSIASGQVTASTTIARTFTGLQPGTWNVAANVPGFDVSPDKSQVVIGKAGDSVKVTFTFTRTTAPLAQFSTGFVTLTGAGVPTVRLPVALRPVSVKAPATVSGTGATGSTDVPITAGFTGAQEVKPTGLAKGFTDSTTIAAGATADRTVTIADGHQGRQVRPRRRQQRGRPGPVRLPAQRRRDAGRRGRAVGDGLGGRAGDPDQPGQGQVPRPASTASPPLRGSRASPTTTPTSWSRPRVGSAV